MKARAVSPVDQPSRSFSQSGAQIASSILFRIEPAGGTCIDPAYVSAPRAIAFPTSGGATAYALYYPPAHPDFEGPPDERPPLVVASHGGPTANTNAQLTPEIQFWTSRGFGFVDVNYGGSTGYGRA